MERSVYIVGAGGHSRSAIDLVEQSGWKVCAVIFWDYPGVGLEKYRCLPFLPMSEIREDSNFLIAIGDNYTRHQIHKLFTQIMPTARFPSLIHPTAAVSPSARIGMGSLIFANSVLGPNSCVGNFVIVNNLSSADHDVTLSDFVSLAPGVVIAGNVMVGLRSAIGIGAKVKHGVNIGSDSVIGAMSFVSKTVPDSIVAWGIPASMIRVRERGERYL